ncbi:hypothetical protein J7E50_10725 [Pedobacter sp. ISL-68]|uniref:hypothetical protein n=1 Tax=unclassified Pedobacter TaxID=2628915 RepID=UPI001BE80A22|nr:MULTISPECIES: hypothetical protein [unclassified Pedobacter]MBT2561304.1 hypothetical protein [Pedobacter sp. ISL-64]MBT2590694.1 hypothetical protein [Pedobacter sp. ISL-68]
MLEAITWKEYLAGLAIVLIGYYAIIGFLIHRNGINITVKKSPDSDSLKKDGSAPSYEEQYFISPDGDEDKDAGEEDKSENLFDELEEIVTDIRHSILEGAGKGADKDMLLEQLKSRVADYGGLRQPAYRVALNNFIIQHAESICGVVFSEDDLEEAWATLPR